MHLSMAMVASHKDAQSLSGKATGGGQNRQWLAIDTW